MDALDSSPAAAPLRDDLLATHGAVLELIASPGSWLDGAERVAVAAESRNAPACALCAERRQSVSPEHPAGEHTTVTSLPAPLVEVVHRVRVDSGRLSRGFYDRMLDAGVTEGEYVEAVGIAALTAGIDYFCRALGVDPLPLPEPAPGAPSGHRPAGAKDLGAFVAMVPPEGATGPEEGLYGDLAFVPNIARALSQVPDLARMLQRWTASHYVPLSALGDPTHGRDLDRVQMELVASRVSAMNECFY